MLQTIGSESSKNSTTKDIAFGSELKLTAEGRKLHDFSERSLKWLFRKVVPKEEMDEFVSQIKTVREDLLKDEYKERIISIKPTDPEDNLIVLHGSNGVNCSPAVRDNVEISPVNLIFMKLKDKFTNSPLWGETYFYKK